MNESILGQMTALERWLSTPPDDNPWGGPGEAAPKPKADNDADDDDYFRAAA